MRRHRAIFIAILGAVLASIAVPAFASTAETAVTETTVAGASTPEPKAPAVSIVEEEPAPALGPWTDRYLIPTSIVIAGALIFGTVVQYFMKVVRTRYKTVE